MRRRGRCATSLERPAGGDPAASHRGSYAAYVFHPVVLVLSFAALRGLPGPPEAKSLALVGVPACFVVGRLLIRVQYVNRVL